MRGLRRGNNVAQFRISHRYLRTGCTACFLGMLVLSGGVLRDLVSQIPSWGVDAFQAPPDSRWGRITTQDVNETYRLLRNNHPGAALTANQSASAPQWRTLPTEAYPKKRDDIDFVDALTGFYGTGKGKLYRTQDGGQSWHLIWSKPGTFIRSLGFIDAQHGFLGNLGAGLANITDTTPLYETRNGGVTWEPAKIGSAAIPGVCSIDILKSRSIYEGDISEHYYIHAGGRANGPAKLLRSENGGQTWALIDVSDRAGMILDVKFFDPNIGFVFAGTSGNVGQSNALILKTTDGGRTWRQVYRSTRLYEIIWKASFPNNLIGYATVQNNDPSNLQQLVVKTVDGGEHWSEIPLITSKGAEELGIGFLSSDKGWVGTSVGGFETSDGGKSWASSTLAPKANKIRLRAADGTLMIYAIGTEVQIYR